MIKIIFRYFTLSWGKKKEVFSGEKTSPIVIRVIFLFFFGEEMRTIKQHWPGLLGYMIVNSRA